jgi:hypothetical protein
MNLHRDIVELLGHDILDIIVGYVMTADNITFVEKTLRCRVYPSLYMGQSLSSPWVTVNVSHLCNRSAYTLDGMKRLNHELNQLCLDFKLQPRSLYIDAFI